MKTAPKEELEIVLKNLANAPRPHGAKGRVGEHALNVVFSEEPDAADVAALVNQSFRVGESSATVLSAEKQSSLGSNIWPILVHLNFSPQDIN